MARVFEKIRCQSEYVMRVLGTGHRENVYHRALITALNKAGIQHRSEVACPIWFMGECVGFGRADLVIDDVIIEIKANKSAPHKTSQQLEKYIVSLSQSERRCFQGIVVNFNQNSGIVDVYSGGSKLFERSVKRKIEPAPPIFIKKARTFEELSKFRYQAGSRK
jgi:GxxExxY protein